MKMIFLLNSLLGTGPNLASRATTRNALEVAAGQAIATNRPLALLGLVMLATFVAALVGLVVDPQVITGAPAWMKPAKFAISISIYAFTLLWLLSCVQGRPRLVCVISLATAVGLFVEMAIIVVQIMRGTTSHFNNSSPLDAALWNAMAALIVVVWLMNLLAAVLLMRQPLSDPAFAWGLRLGLLISLLGMAIAFPMAPPTSAQITEARVTGQPLTITGAHTVGAPDGGPGLPVVGWSTQAGDLRVAHFVGLHGLQVMPFAAWLIGRRRRLNPGHRVALVWTVASAYTGLVLVLGWQALRGQPVMAPDAMTVVVLAGLLGVTILMAAGILRHARRIVSANQ